MPAFYHDAASVQQNIDWRILSLFSKAAAVRAAGRENGWRGGSCHDATDRPTRDLTAAAGGWAGPVYLDVPQQHRQTAEDRAIVWRMCCNYVLTSRQEAN